VWSYLKDVAHFLLFITLKCREKAFFSPLSLLDKNSGQQRKELMTDGIFYSPGPFTKRFSICLVV